MGTISIRNSSNLFWLGRYAERIYTTLIIFFDYYDKMLDRNKSSYREFLQKLGIKDKYGDYQNFIQGFLYGDDSFSVYSVFRGACDNAIVIRNTIGSESLAYIDLATNLFQGSRKAKNIRLALMPCIDYLLAFWGSVDNKIASGQARNIIKCGKLIERLDLYFRFGLDSDQINGEFEKLCNVLSRVQKSFYDAQQLSVLVDILAVEDSYKERLDEALGSLSKLFQELAS